MTVTELREALQKLEAEGHGQLKVAYSGWNNDSPCFFECSEPKIATFFALDETMNPAWKPGQEIVVI